MLHFVGAIDPMTTLQGIKISEYYIRKEKRSRKEGRKKEIKSVPDKIKMLHGKKRGTIH